MIKQMKKRTKITLSVMALAGILMVSGCAMSPYDEPVIHISPYDGGKEVTRWYIDTIRTSQGGVITANIADAYYSDLIVGDHLSSETYMLDFYKDHFVFYNRGAEGVKGTYQKNGRNDFIFEINETIFYGECTYNEVSENAERLDIIDPENDVYYSFTLKANFFESQYTPKKAFVENYIASLKETDFELYSINKNVADGTNTYRSKTFDSTSYDVEFVEKEEKGNYLNFKSKTSDGYDVAAFKVDFKPIITTNNVSISADLTYDEEESTDLYYSDIKSNITLVKHMTDGKPSSFVISTGSNSFLFVPKA